MVMSIESVEAPGWTEGLFRLRRYAERNAPGHCVGRWLRVSAKTAYLAPSDWLPRVIGYTIPDLADRVRETAWLDGPLFILSEYRAFGGRC